MEPFSPIWFVGGIILGFVAEYLLDLLFWRRRLQRVAAANSSLVQSREREQQELLHLRERVDTLDAALHEKEEALVAHDADLQALRIQRDDMAVQREATMARAAQLEEELEKVNERYNQCQQMLSDSRGEMRTLERTPIGELQMQHRQQLTALESELKQARNSAGELQQTLTDVQAESADLAAALERLQEANQDKETLVARLERDAADLREMLEARDQALADCRRMLTAEQAAGPAAPDRLQRIRGIGDVYAQKLNAAGVIRFAQLLEMDEQQIRAIINPANWQELKIAEWKAEAARFTAEQGEENDD